MESLQREVAQLLRQQDKALQCVAAAGADADVVAYNGTLYRARSLTKREIQLLQRQQQCQVATGGSSTAAWPTLWIPSLPYHETDDNRIAACLAKHVSRTTFGPNVVFVLSPSLLETSTATINYSNNNKKTSHEIKTTSANHSGSFPSHIATTMQAALDVTGCHDNGHVSHSILDLQATCRSNAVVQYTILQAGAVLWHCGTVTTTMTKSTTNASSSSLRSLSLQVGPETGGSRIICLDGAATMADVTQQLVPPSKNQAPKKQTEKETVSSHDYNLFLSNSYVGYTPLIEQVVVHGGAYIDSATAVQQAWLFPGAALAHHVTAQYAILQWKARIANHCTVDHVYLMECAAVGPHSVSSHSVLGPDVHISAGEVHASILGPNTNAHHQSLCIGVLWPHGRGNVGYGANVGSNHTGRLPDQEVVSGEGLFWGLSCVVVMPVNLSQSPYSIVAAGTTLPAPQRVHMPFSLFLSSPSSDNGNNNNNNNNSGIVPGWVYAKSPYTVVRSAHKYATRRKAKRHAYYTGWEILRPSVVQLCVQARWGLQEQSQEQQQRANSIPNLLGSLHCSDKARALGIQTYTNLIQRYALQELLQLCLRQEQQPVYSAENIVKSVRQALSVFVVAPPSFSKTEAELVAWAPFPWDEPEGAEYESSYKRMLLVQEFPLTSTSSSKTREWIRLGLMRLAQLEQDFVQAVVASKSRDDVRGAATVPQYAEAHVAATDDPVIHRLQKETQQTLTHIQKIVQVLQNSSL